MTVIYSGQIVIVIQKQNNKDIDVIILRDFRTIINEELIYAIKRLNNHPRKKLRVKTPSQSFFKQNVSIISVLTVPAECWENYQILYSLFESNVLF